MTAGQLRTFLRELPEETHIDFQFGAQPLDLLMLGTRLDRAELIFTESASAPGNHNDKPAGEMPARTQ